MGELILWSDGAVEIQRAVVVDDEIQASQYRVKSSVELYDLLDDLANWVMSVDHVE